MSVAANARSEANPHRNHAAAPTRRFDMTWPVKGSEIVRLLVAYVVVTGTGILVGLAYTDVLAPNPVTRLDERVADAFADHRTGFLNTVALWSTTPADTYVKIAISTVICLVFLWVWRRWDDAVYVALPLVFEASCFIVITSVVARPRPDVDRLIESTINSSYPSGHAAAATVYAAVVVVVFRHTGRVWIRAITVGVFAVVLVGVLWARLYLGMHYLSDVVAGVVLGATSLVISDRILRRHHHERRIAAEERPAEVAEPVTGAA